MADCIKKHLLFLSAWIICMGYVLLFNFTWIALCILILMSLVSLYFRVLSEKSSKRYYITDNIRYYIIFSMIFFECVYICKYLNKFNFKRIVSNLFKILGDLFDNLFGFIGNNAAAVIITGIVLFILFYLRNSFKKYSFIHTVLEYQLIIYGFSVFYLAILNNLDALLGYLIISYIFIMGDISRKLYDEDELMTPYAGIWSFAVLSFVMLIVLLINPMIRNQLKAFKINLFIDIFSKWSTFLLLFVLIGIVFFLNSMIIVRDHEVYVFANILSFILVLFISLKLYTIWSWLLLLIHVTFSLIHMNLFGPRSENYNICNISNSMAIPISAVVISFLLIGISTGNFIIFMVFIITTFAAVLLAYRMDIKAIIKNNRYKNNPYKEYPYLASAALIWLYLNALTILFIRHWHIDFLIIISVMLILFIVTILLSNHNLDIYENNIFVNHGQFVLPVFFIVISLILLVYGRTDITISVDDDTVNITVETNDKENSIVDAKYCWLYDITDIANNMVNNSSEYIQFSDEIKLEKETGLLKVVVEDKNGIITTKNIWCSNSEPPV